MYFFIFPPKLGKDSYIGKYVVKKLSNAYLIYFFISNTISYLRGNFEGNSKMGKA